jgi:hypothetical protein
MADERKERYRKLDELMDEGPNPFPYDFERTDSIGSVVEKFDGEEEPIIRRNQACRQTD